MPADGVKRKVADTVRSIVAGSDKPPGFDEWNPNDPGMIPADSPARTVHGDPAMFVGGVRALLFQTLHPIAMQAVAEHSDYENDPLGRLQRTAFFLGAVTFGSGTEAHHSISRINAIHESVTGIRDDNGKPYRADDPRLLGWVHATEVDSFLVAYQRYGKTRLTAEECDRYVADMAVVGEALGVETAPTSVAGLAAALDSYREELAPTRYCRDATRFLFAPALPITVLPFYGLIFSSAVALLPRHVRVMLLLPLAPGIDSVVLRPAMTAMTKTLRWATTPDSEPV